MKMHQLLITFALGAALFISGCSSKAAQVPEFALEKSGSGQVKTSDPCVGAERCVIGYFAPHCSRCHRSVDFLKSLRDELSRVPGVRVVYIVGDDNHYNIEEFAYELGGETYLDKQFKFQEAVTFDSIPHFWVIDQNRTVLQDITWGGSGSATRQEILNFAESTLGLESYLSK